MAREKYSINGQAGKEKMLEYAAGLFGDSPENLKTMIESICQQILEAEITQTPEGKPLRKNGQPPGTPQRLQTKVFENKAGRD